MHYIHLLLWDANQLELVGAYRFASSAKVLELYGKEGLYTDTLFQYSDNMAPYFKEGLELGRSFVQPKYWGRKSLDYLWYGIGAFIKRYPEHRYLFGAVSLSNALPEDAKALLVHYYQHYYGNQNALAKPNHEFKLTPLQLEYCKQVFAGDDMKEDFAELKYILGNMGAQVPTLFKQYTELCEPNGVSFLSFSIDPEFNNCIDGLVLVDLQGIKANKAKRYLGDVKS